MTKSGDLGGGYSGMHKGQKLYWSKQCSLRRLAAGMFVIMA